MDDVTEGYDGFNERAVWDLKFAWLPKKCAETGETIWLEAAYRGTVAWGEFTADPAYEYRWIKKYVWLIEKIKGRI